MNEYELLLSKIQKLKSCSNCNLSPSESKLMTDALIIVQVLEAMLAMRRKPKNHA